MTSIPLLPHRWTAADIPDQSGRTAVVTGANSGLGLRTAEALAAKGARVLMACRNQTKAAAALDTVAAAATGPKPEVVPLDLADLSSVHAAAAQLNDTVDRLDLLVNNAGVMATPRGRTVDGFDTQFGTNHLGHFAFTGLLLPTLLRATRADSSAAAAGVSSSAAAEAPRVVTVSSVAAWSGLINWADPNWKRIYLRWPAYGQSKLANLLFTAELARRSRAAHSPLVAAAAHPGLSATHLYDLNGEKGAAGTLAGVPQAVLFSLAQSDRMGALPQLYVATMPGVRGNSYMGPGFEFAGYPRRTLRNPLANGRRRAERLWKLSEDLTGVRYEWTTR